VWSCVELCIAELCGVMESCIAESCGVESCRVV
jgi:hypothetical protein